MGAFTRLQSYNRLRNRDWRFPSRVLKEEMPPDMRGADLAKLDVIFERAMSARNIRYVELGQFMFDIRKAVMRPENAPYADKPALKPMIPGVTPSEEARPSGPYVPAITPIPEEDSTKVEAERQAAKPAEVGAQQSKPTPKIEIKIPKTETIAPPPADVPTPPAPVPTPPPAQPIPYHPTITPILENEEPEKPAVIPRVLMTNLEMQPVRARPETVAPRTPHIQTVWIVIGVLAVIAVLLMIAVASRGGL
jgi:hypothetical protein